MFLLKLECTSVLIYGLNIVNYIHFYGVCSCCSFNNNSCRLNLRIVGLVFCVFLQFKDRFLLEIV